MEWSRWSGADGEEQRSINELSSVNLQSLRDDTVIREVSSIMWAD